MAGYRRFIAYVYEYRKGKKENNCGFIKVEVRDEACTMEAHLHVEGLAENEECKVYCFLRKEGLMNGILLGTCETEKERIECFIETDALNVGNSGMPLGKMGGMILTTKSGGFFGTEWDDQPIRPENFKEAGSFVEERKGEQEAAEPAAENMLEPDTELTAEAVPEPSPETSEECTKRPETEEFEEMKSGSSTGIAGDTLAESEAAEEVQQESNTSLFAETTSEPLHMQSSHAERVRLPFGQEFCPFEDSDVRQCWKIHPQDLVHFPRRQCALRNNRFLQYGYYNFGHLLLCRRQNGRYIIGVPGCYEQQEQFMAGMFGFSCFKPSKQIKVPKGKGGYWYRAIDPPGCC